MGFFWSGPRASIAGIFRRSARYWLHTYLCNKLYRGPNALRPDPVFQRAYQRYLDSFDEEGIWEKLNRGQTKVQVAYYVMSETNREGNLKGWDIPKKRRITKARCRRLLDLNIQFDDEVGVGRTAWERNQPAAIDSSGGLRGGAARQWARRRYS